MVYSTTRDLMIYPWVCVLNNTMPIQVLRAFSLAWPIRRSLDLSPLVHHPHLYGLVIVFKFSLLYWNFYLVSYNYTLSTIKLLVKSLEMIWLSKQIIIFFSILHTTWIHVRRHISSWYLLKYVSPSPCYRLVVDRFYHCDFDVVINTTI